MATWVDKELLANFILGGGWKKKIRFLLKIIIQRITC